MATAWWETEGTNRKGSTQTNAFSPVQQEWQRNVQRWQSMLDRMRAEVPAAPLTTTPQPSSLPSGERGFVPQAAPAGQVLPALPERYGSSLTPTQTYGPSLPAPADTRSLSLKSGGQQEPAASNFWEWLWRGTKGRVEEAWHKPEQAFVPPEQGPGFWEQIVAGHEELQGQPLGKQIVGAFSRAPGILVDQVGNLLGNVGEAWQEHVGETPIGQGVAQVGGAGLQLLQEPANLAEQLVGGAWVGLKGGAEEIPVEKWAPLTERTWSLAWQQVQERLGFRDEAELQPGEETTEAWGRDVIGQALQDIRSGRRTADEIVNEEALPMAEFIGAFAADPLNLIDAINPSNLRRLNKAIDSANLAYATRVAELATAGENVEDASRALHVFGGAEKALEAMNPLALSATAMVEQDLSNVYLLTSGLVEDAKTGREALKRLADWRMNPGRAADLYGEAFASERGLAALKALEGADLENLVSAVPGRPFSPRMFAHEVAMDTREALEQAHGVVDPTGYRKFAKGFKNYSSEAYLTMNPGYWVRNGGDNTTTLAYDGILALDRPAELDNYLQRAATVSQRVATKGGQAESPLPGVLGRFSTKVKDLVGKSPVGEESFYRRGYVGAHRKTLSRLWHSGANVPDVPAELAPFTTDLQAAARSGMNLEEIQAAVNKVLTPQSPGDSLQFVMRYLDDEQLQALSPAMLEHLREGVMQAGSREDVQTLLQQAREAILEHGDEALRTEPLDPADYRAVWTETELAEIKGRLATSMLEDARRFGLDEDAALATVAESIRRMEIQDAVSGQAATRTMQRAVELQSNEAMQLAYRANRRAQKAHEETQRIVDAARAQAWAAAEQVGGKGAARRAEVDGIWRTYFATATREWEKNFHQRLTLMEEAYQDLERLGAGIPFQEITGFEARAILEEAAVQQADVARVARLDPAAAETFDDALAIHRAKVEVARTKAFEAARATADQRTLDILDSADRMSQTMARKWRAERDYLRESMLGRKERALSALEEAKKLGKEAGKAKGKETNVELFNIEMWYRQAQDALAKERFRELGQVWQVAELEIRGAPAQTRVERLLALQLQHQYNLDPAEAARVAAERMGVGPLPEGRLADVVPSVADEVAGIKDVGLLDGEGAARHARVHDLLAITEPEALSALDKIEDGLLRDWDLWQGRQADAALVNTARAWVEGDVARNLRDAHIAAAAAAEQVTNFALHDYSRTTKLDEFLSLIYPYHFWYSRAGLNWARRLANNPSRLANYVRYKQMMANINEERGLRARFEGKWKLPVPEAVRDALGLEWMSPAVYFDPVQFMFPYATFDRADFGSEEETNNWLARAYRNAKTYLPKPYAFLQVPLQLSEVADLEERETLTDILPQTGPIRAATAIAGIGGPSGVDIEAPLRRAMQLPAQEQWQPYQVRRMLASMAADDPDTALTALRAQELQDRVEAQELKLAVAIGDEETKGSELYDLAQEFNWTPDQVTSAQAMLREATHRAALELGIRRLTSYTTGVGQTVLAEGEEKQLALQREGLGLLWSPENQAGSYAAYRAWKDEHPEVVARQKQYRELPDVELGGEVEIQAREGLSPGYHANYLELRAAKEKVHAEFDQAEEELLKKNPGNWDGYRALEDKRYEMLADLAGQWPLPESEQESLDLASGELPEGWTGQSPGEYAEYVAEQVAWAVRDTEPKPELFAGENNEVDWEAYYNALDAWEAEMPETLPQLDAVRALGGTYAGLSLPEIVEATKQKYDSPVEAVAKVYRSQVQEARDRYYELKETGDRQAFDKTLAQWYDRDVPANALVDLVLAEYPEKGWTAQDLQAMYKGMVFRARQETTSKPMGVQPATEAGAPGVPGAGDYAAGSAGGSSATSSRYGELAARVEDEGWRSVYGKPWWEKYPRGGRGGRASSSSASGSRWVPPRWKEPYQVYGGPYFRRS